MSPFSIVVLAAGLGSRLGRPFPKPLAALKDGRSIMQQQFDGLGEAFPGRPVHVVVGFKKELIMEEFPDAIFLYNADYYETNTSKSLLRALQLVPDGGVLWLNGDVVFDPAVLELALPFLQGGQSFVCVDTNTVAEEEVKYTLDRDGFVHELSKTVVGGLGEAVGINFVSADDKAALLEHLDRCGDGDYFERGMETAIEERGLRFRPVDISEFAAVEVDFETDLARANSLLPGDSRNVVAEGV